MADITVRDKYNKIIGYCREYPDCINAFHMSKGLVGYYSKNSDTTFERNGKIYCRGDGTQSLIREAERDA